MRTPRKARRAKVRRGGCWLLGLAAWSWVGLSGALAGARPVEPPRQQSGVSERETEALIDGCRAAGFTEEETQRMVRLVVGAKLAGLPHVDLVNKLREGVAKGADPEVVVTAVEAKARVLRRAKGVVDALVLDGELPRDYPFAVQIVADALEAGMDGAAIQRAVREGGPGAPGAPDVRKAFPRRGAGSN